MPVWEYNIYMSRTATTADAFNALGDRTRRAILHELAAREYTVGTLAETLGRTQPQVSKHLRVLRHVGLVKHRSAGRSRVYEIDPSGLAPLQDWLATLVARVNASSDRLDDYLHELQASPARQNEEHSNANETRHGNGDATV